MCRLDPTGRPVLPWRRWSALASLLVGELLLLTVRFDGRRAADSGFGWDFLVSKAHAVPRVAAAAAAALFLLRGGRVRRVLEVVSAGDSRPDRWPGWLLAHLTAFGGFAALTGVVMEGDPAAGPLPGAAAVAWAAAGAATLGFWFAAVVPPRRWAGLCRHAGGSLAAAAAVGVAAYAAGRLTSGWWDGLHAATFHAAHALLRLVDADAVCDPENLLVGTRSFAVRVHASCSGYEGIGLLWVFLGATFWVARGRLRFPHALLLVPLGTAALWAANVVRIALLVAVGTWGSPELAVGGFHSQAGWLAFNAVALGLLAGALRVPFFASGNRATAFSVMGHGLPTTPRRPTEGLLGPAEKETRGRAAWGGRETAPQPHDAHSLGCAPVNLTAAYLTPLLAATAAGMLATALTPDPARWYPLRVVAAVAMLLTFRNAYPRWGWAGAWRGMIPGAAVFVLWQLLAPPSAAEPPALAGPAAAAWLAFRLVGTAVVLPLAEELAFRGYLTRRLASSDFESLPVGAGAPWAVVGSSLLFGLLHGGWLAGTIAGLGYALTLRRRGALADAVVAHGTTNALLAAFALATGDWSRWS